jgi:AcrR family transcriptional regulator
MARTSHNLDKKLLKAGRKLLIKKGAAHLSIRELTQTANVNLGMFSYHFKSKDNFIEQVLDDIYQDFFADLLTQESEDVPPLEQLERYLLIITRFAVKNRELIVALLQDILDGQEVVQKFCRRAMRRHFLLLAKTIRAGQKCQEIIDAPLLLLLTHIVGGAGLANVAPVILKRTKINRVFDLALSLATKEISSEEAIHTRVKITINGIKR